MEKVYQYSRVQIKNRGKKGFLLLAALLIMNAGLIFMSPEHFELDASKLDVSLFTLSSIVILFAMWFSVYADLLTLKNWRLVFLDTEIHKFNGNDLKERAVYSEIEQMHLIRSVKDQVQGIQVSYGSKLMNFYGFEGQEEIFSLLLDKCPKAYPKIKVQKINFSSPAFFAIFLVLTGVLFWISHSTASPNFYWGLVEIVMGAIFLALRPTRNYTNNSQTKLDWMIGFLFLISGTGRLFEPGS